MITCVKHQVIKPVASYLCFRAANGAVEDYVLQRCIKRN